MSHSIISEASWPLVASCPKCGDTRARRQYPDCATCGSPDVSYRPAVKPVPSSVIYRPFFRPNQPLWFLRDGQIVSGVVTSIDDPQTGMVRLLCEGQRANRPSVHRSKLFTSLENAQEGQDVFYAALPTAAERIVNRPSHGEDKADFVTYVDGWHAPVNA